MGHLSVFNVAVAMLAFMIAFFTLAARERRTPLIVNSIYNAFYVIFAAVILSVLATVTTSIEIESTDLENSLQGLAWTLNAISMTLLVMGLSVIFSKIWRLHNQHKNFRTDARVRNIGLVRKARILYEKIRKGQDTYTDNPTEFSAGLLQCIESCKWLPTKDTKRAIDRAHIGLGSAHSICAAVRVISLDKADHMSADLASRFLKHKALVQYASCARHPIEFWRYLEKIWKHNNFDEAWTEASKRITLIDAFTPHFGFTDSVHAKMTMRLNETGSRILVSDPSFAGLHTATMKGFKQTKSQDGGKSSVRKPTLVIYEGAYALVELESTEQYRIFMRHVIPSERLWGGMFTLIVEASMNESDMSIVRSYADIYVNGDTPVVDPDRIPLEADR